MHDLDYFNPHARCLDDLRVAPGLRAVCGLADDDTCDGIGGTCDPKEADPWCHWRDDGVAG